VALSIAADNDTRRSSRSDSVNGGRDGAGEEPPSRSERSSSPRDSSFEESPFFFAFFFVLAFFFFFGAVAGAVGEGGRGGGEALDIERVLGAAAGTVVMIEMNQSLLSRSSEMHGTRSRSITESPEIFRRYFLFGFTDSTGSDWWYSPVLRSPRSR
jgi:hypothetical protein